MTLPIVQHRRLVSMLLVATTLLLLPANSRSFALLQLPQHQTHSFDPSSRRGAVVAPPAFLLTTRNPPAWQPARPRRRTPHALLMAASNPDSDDPFQVLGMDEPTTDKKVIKRAYKRMALQYHPDVATTKDSPPEEKKRASDRFAKINWAYEVLSGKRQNDSTYNTKTSSSTSAGSGTSGWSPPHRRSGAYSSPSSSGGGGGGGDSNTGDFGGGGVDWTDFMPKDYDEAYDAGGDSFTKIFSDLFVGAAAGAAGLGGRPSVFRDFIEFLEGNVDGFGGGAEADAAELRMLLQTGDLDEIRNELDDTELVVQQLKSKLTGIKDEILTLTAQAAMATRYMEKIELEESLAELNARKDVVEGYVKKAQKRLLALQTRYKELLTSGGRDSYGSRGSSRSAWDDINNEATGDGGSRSASSYSSSGSGTASSTSSSSTTGPTSGSTSGTQRPSKSGEDSWMNESFGSSTYGRGGGEGRRRSRRRPSSSGSSTSTDSSQSRTTRDDPETAVQSPRGDAASGQGATSSTSGSYRSSNAGPGTSSNKAGASSSSLRSTSTSSNSNVPPHRRTSGSYENQQERDKRRLRELKVDDEFDKLKKELGL